MDLSFDLLGNALVSGLLLGGFYAAVTIGVSISFGMLDIVNIAHPAFIVLGSYGAWLLNDRWGIDPILASLHFGVIELPLRLLVPCLVSLFLIALMQTLLSRSFIGRAVQAVAQDALALRLMAADPVRIKRIAFGLSIATASVAGAVPSSSRSSPRWRATISGGSSRSACSAASAASPAPWSRR